jgi:dihydrofolate synthase/folylpolyglutamate synthase
MNYTEATQWLFDQLPMYQQKGAVALNAKLDGITEFLCLFGRATPKI